MDVVTALRLPVFPYLMTWWWWLIWGGGENNALLVLLDLSAAFNTTDHSLLPNSLHSDICFDSTVLDWFSSFLSCGTQQVLVGHYLPVKTPLVCGVLQGSVLGPFLFSLHTRQLAELIHKFCIDYHISANDFELCSHLPLVCDESDGECCVFSSWDEKWIMKNWLKLNEWKTEVLLCRPRYRRESVPVDSLMVGKASIPFTRLVKPLGVTFDAALSFDQHASTVVRSCFFHVRSLSKVCSYLISKAANSITVSLILSKLDYCNSLLAGLP